MQRKPQTAETKSRQRRDAKTAEPTATALNDDELKRVSGGLITVRKAGGVQQEY
jgi:hypothetical protein